MTKTHSTKRALVASLLILSLCFASLIGTTFAWFTDSVTSANNIIKSGNLDIVLEYYDTEAKEWKDVKDSKDVLTGDLWEPGYTDVAYLRIKNNGSLALKYALSVNIISEKEGTNKAGVSFKLSDYIYFDVVEGKEPAFANRTEAMAAVDSKTKISKGYSQSASLGASSEFVYLAMVVYMPTDVGNDANHNGENIPNINLGINIFATQDTVESDSFGTDYDKDNAVYTVAEANAMLAENKDVTLVACTETDGVLKAPVGYSGTLTLVDSKIKSVQAEENINVVIIGTVVVDANGSGAATVSEGAVNASAITANGELNISGSGTLTAIAADVNGAFGIGGMNTKSINIEGITIERAEGAYSYEVGTDPKYYKDAPEGGAAIGSGFDGAVITLDGVTVINAIGGSKAAGIGARYHVGVTVNVIDSAIAYVEGGVTAAGIGGSRVSGGATESGTTINITNSEVTAVGGAYGAGIGSGYDTHCGSEQPMCTVNITDSTINATGGRYAAGIGTGYHNAALSGEIKNSTVNAKSGEKWYKDAYTCAIDIGFGVVDPAREGTQTDSKIIYNGVKIGIPAPGKVASVSSLEALIAALEEKIPNIYLEEEIQINEALTVDYNARINGNGNVISRASGYTGTVMTAGANSTLTLENIVLDGSGATATGNLIAASNNSSIILNEGAVLQNNNGSHAINLGTRIGATLTINGGEIINNSSDSGAIWGGGHITMNAGKINNNSSTGPAGAIRMVSDCNITVNGGEICNNHAAGDGGAIWGYGINGNTSVYNLNGGKISNNTADGTGGAIYSGNYSVINLSGDFEICNNTATDSGAMRLTNYTTVNMNGGKISGNVSTGNANNNGFYGWCPIITFEAGELADNVTIDGGHKPTIGGTDISGIVYFQTDWAYLKSEFGALSYTVQEGKLSSFCFYAADNYVYTEGDEAKLICMNEGYSTYWDAATGTFKLQAN